MGRVKFSEKILVKRDQLEVFDFTQDYSSRLVWDKFLIKAELLNGSNEAGFGEKAYCMARNGIGMETEYVSYKRPKVTAIKMTKRPFIFKSFWGSWTFNNKSKDETEVVFLYSFVLRFLFSLASFLMKRILRKEVKGRLNDLKEFMGKEHTIASSTHLLSE